MTEREQERIVAGLAALRRDMERTEEAPPELETKLRAEFRQNRKVIAFPAAWRLASAAAAVVVLAAGAVWWIGQSKRRAAPVAAHPPTVAPVPEPVRPPEPVVAQRAVAAAPRLAARTPRAPRVRPAEPEVYSDFLPVAGSDPFESFDRGQLVRVELPRSAMSYFGLPVNPARARERVNAEVVLGESGTARAIRFVQDRR